jgi:hypothetical protein
MHFYLKLPQKTIRFFYGNAHALHFFIIVSAPSIGISGLSIAKMGTFQGVTAIHFSNTNGTRSAHTGTRSSTTFRTRSERVPLVAGWFEKFK